MRQKRKIWKPARGNNENPIAHVHDTGSRIHEETEITIPGSSQSSFPQPGHVSTDGETIMRDDIEQAATPERCGLQRPSCCSYSQYNRHNTGTRNNWYRNSSTNNKRRWPRTRQCLSFLGNRKRINKPV